MTNVHPIVQQRIEEFTANEWWGSRTLNDMFAETVQASPSAAALLDQPNRNNLLEGEPQRFTWSELNEEVGYCASVLHKQGLGAGDVVLTQLPNVSELVILFLAVSRLGATISPVPVQYGRHEMELIAGKLNPKVFVGATHCGPHQLIPAVENVDVGVRLWVGADVPDKGLSFTAELDTVRASGERIESSLVNDANSVFTICWTSGTTGNPKGVPRTHNQWISIAQATYEAAEIQIGDVLLNPFPFVNMASIGGFLFNWIRSRSAMALHHPLDLPVFLTQIQKEKVTFTIAPPALLNMLLKNEELMAKFDISTLRTIASGSAPLSPWMVGGFAEKYGIGVVNLFGSNEGLSLVSSVADIPNHEQRATYFPRFGVEGLSWKASVSRLMKTRLRDLQTGEIITQEGQPGELEVYGATLFDHYLGQEPGDRDTFTSDGYFKTGDLFEIAGDSEPKQFYRFVGRSKDIIIRGGFNISPDEIDIALAANPKLAEAATVGFPCDDMGERICVFVVAKEGEDISLEDIKSHLKAEGFASFKMPERIEHIDKLPRNALGKVLRNELRAKL
ncbi:MAG: acyl--CoA ligase [Aliidiomarina sp.]|uniref:class I adenylate-forming enzyme family protein n=1 Tax=Aliidiomarina sp. TaxID=1872439 RepID=UPI0025C411B6|nr:class I adenylate-forming enzyme family protein [Aliidiomarina sp.]MCH8501191.1 acyl--CoA ligase [Aliidiomarina sp.]